MGIDDKDYSNYETSEIKKLAPSLNNNDITGILNEYMYKMTELEPDQEEYVDSRNYGKEYKGKLDNNVINVLDGHLDADYDHGGRSGLSQIRHDLNLLPLMSAEKQKMKLEEISSEIDRRISEMSLSLLEDMADDEINVKELATPIDTSEERKSAIQSYLGSLLVYNAAKKTTKQLQLLLKNKAVEKNK